MYLAGPGRGVVPGDELSPRLRGCGARVAAGEQVEQPVEVEPAAVGEHAASPRARIVDGHDHLVARLRDLAGAQRAEVHRRAAGRSRRGRREPRRRRAADHDRQRRRRRRRRPRPRPGQSTTRTAPAVSPASRRRRARTPAGDEVEPMISSRSPLGREQAVGAVEDRLDLGQVGEHGARASASGGEVAGLSCPTRAVRSRASRRGGACARDDRARGPARSRCGHRQPHRAEPDERRDFVAVASVWRTCGRHYRADQS